MKQYLLSALLALTIINACTAVMIESEVTPHKGDRKTQITISYVLDPSVKDSARVKLYLDNYNPITNSFDSNIDKTLIEYFEINPLNTSPIQLELTNEPSMFYRICMRLSYNSKYYTDCDSNNQFLLIDDTPITNYLVLPSQSIELTVESEKTVLIDEDFITNVSIKNTGSSDITVVLYSYALNNSEKISQGDWDSNSQTILITPNSIAKTKLSNKVSYNGTFQLRVRADYGKKFDVTNELIVIENKTSRVIIDKPLLINEQIRVTVTNLGQVTENLTLLVYTNNGETINNLLLKPRTCKEVFISSANITGFIKSILYRDNILILQSDSFIDSNKQNTNLTVENFEQKNDYSLQISNEENVLLLLSNQTTNETNFKNNSFSLAAPQLSTENLLYSLIVGVSLISAYVVIKKV